MWIETTDGNMLNLSLAAEIRLVRGKGIYACHPAADSPLPLLTNEYLQQNFGAKEKSCDQIFSHYLHLIKVNLSRGTAVAGILEFMKYIMLQWPDLFDPVSAEAPAIYDSLHVSDLRLPLRAERGLVNAGIETVGHLRNKTYSDIARLRNMGRLSVKSITDALGRLGLKLRK